MIGVCPDHRWVVIGATIVSGIFIGLNNTLVTTAVMSIAPVPRPVASATYGFVRFIGGGLAPFAAGKLVEHYNAHVPFILGAVTVVAARVVLSTVHSALAEADAEEGQAGPSRERADAEEAVCEVPGAPDEAILAEEALREDRSHAAYPVAFSTTMRTTTRTAPGRSSPGSRPSYFHDSSVSTRRPASGVIDTRPRSST